MEELFRHIDKNEKKYIFRLAESVAIPSVSGWPENRGEVKNMIDWTVKRLEAIGASCQLKELGEETLPDGNKIPLPPVIFAQLGEDPKKKTLLVYGHLDVQPAAKEDGWDTEPFILTEKDGKLFGRGATDDKGPVLDWINCIEAMQDIHMEVPINIKFVLEGMEESGSLGLDELVLSEKKGFLKGTDFVCISDNYWLGKTKPCITYGLRGICYFFLEVQCASKDLHSGVFGGTVPSDSDIFYVRPLKYTRASQWYCSVPVGRHSTLSCVVKRLCKDAGFVGFYTNHSLRATTATRLYENGVDEQLIAERTGHRSTAIRAHEAMTDLIKIMSSLVDNKGRILIENIYDTVKPVTDEEKQLYEPIDFDPEEYRKDIGATKLIHSKKEDALMHRWRHPSLSLHGIEGAFAGSGAKTVIPRKVIGKFSIRLVPDQDPETVKELVQKHVDTIHSLGGSPNLVTLTMGHGGRPWVSDFNNPNYVAGRNAMKTVFGVEPDLTREGGSIPVTLTFQEATEKNVMLLPVGACDDGAHSQNEKIDKINYINGIKLMGAYMSELAKL